MADPFRDKAAEYDERPLPQQLSELVVAALRARVPLSPDLVVMDFGAGTGLVSARLAPDVAHVHAVDVSPAMLARLTAKEELRGKVTAHCVDLAKQALGLQVDLVVSAMAFHHVEHPLPVLRALRAHLRPGGRLAIADLDAEDGTFHPPEAEGVHHHGFDRSALAETMREAGFRDVVFGDAGTVHRDGRRYAVFLATAQIDAPLG